MPSERRAPLALTTGEPAGVGPEITGRAWQALRNEANNSFFLIGDAAYLQTRVGTDVPVVAINHPDDALGAFANALPVLNRTLAVHPALGRIEAATAHQVIASIKDAVELTLAGVASGIVTNPIQKETLYAAGFTHQGHTDYLASLARAKGHTVHEVMMLVAQDLRAVPITVHIALSEVPRALSREAIIHQARVVDAGLRRHFAIARPRIAVTGLNPHAGENGAMGTEEDTLIRPALAQLQAEGIAVFGPLPADTAFHAEARAQYDAILCMYHDQALIPVKTLDFHGGVNVTLGLPFIRTSPDHGTALGIAGKGTANPASLIAAIRLAARMVSAGT